MMGKQNEKRCVGCAQHEDSRRKMRETILTLCFVFVMSVGWVVGAFTILTVPLILRDLPTNLYWISVPVILSGLYVISGFTLDVNEKVRNIGEVNA